VEGAQRGVLLILVGRRPAQLLELAPCHDHQPGKITLPEGLRRRLVAVLQISEPARDRTPSVTAHGCLRLLRSSGTDERAFVGASPCGRRPQPPRGGLAERKVCPTQAWVAGVAPAPAGEPPAVRPGPPIVTAGPLVPNHEQVGARTASRPVRILGCRWHT